MISKKSRLCGQILSVCSVMFLLAFTAWAETDPNPDSPSPILISEPNSLRALATNAVRVGQPNLTRVKSQAFAPDSKFVLYVTNLDLMADEGANALRVNVEDENGRPYRFPVLSIEPLKGQGWVYALTVLAHDELGFYAQLPKQGDILVSVTWRGLASNRLKLGFGKIGGDIKTDDGAAPTPFPTSPIKKSSGADETNYIGYQHSGDRTRFEEQAAFGPSQSLDDRIRRVGLRVWLEEQFNATYPTNPYPNFPLMPVNAPVDCNGQTDNGVPDPDPLCFRNHYSMYPVQNWFYKEAFYGDAQLKHRVSWSLSQLWVTSGVDIQQSRHMTEYHKILSNNAFGNYRNLMAQMTLNPAMGDYLDMVRSTKNSPNENYAREILQLFNVGLFMLNPDGTLQRDANNNPIPTYDQTTVNNFTKVFTGWNFCQVQTSCPNIVVGTVNFIDPLLLNQNNHNVEAKTLLPYCGIGVPQTCGATPVSQNIAANTNGTTELNQALDNIYNHPNVAPLVSRFLIQQMVTSDPTPAYVGRVSAVFTANRMNPSQMKEVVKAILLDPEARGNTKTDPNYGKLREPVQLATNLYRQFNVKSADLLSQSDGYVDQIVTPMGQSAFRSPTVFNYYSPGYVVPGPGLNAPEFGILTTGTAISRTNFVNTVVFSRINVSAPFVPNGTAITLADMQALAAADTTSNLLLDTLNTKMMHGTMTAQNKATIMTAVNAAPTNTPLLRAQTAIYLIATSSQYQVQR